MTWDFFLQNALVPLISAGVAILASWLFGKGRKTTNGGILEVVKTQFSDLKLDIQKMFSEFKVELEERIEKNNEKNENTHKEFYHRHETHNVEIALLKQEIDSIKKQHEKNHGG